MTFDINRRQSLMGLAALIGAGSLPIDALAAAAKAAPFLSPAQTALVTAVADTLIPTTDTPGAAKAGVPRVFDGLMRKWAAPATRTALLGALGAIDAAAKSGAGKPFALLSPKARLEVLGAYDTANWASNPDYRRLKDLLTKLYYFSEIGATQELRYEHAPGAWEASIPVTPKTRVWADASGR
ncbi:hypothetical protein GTZ99_06230 [Novosphingobium sp. FSY-8]|uniref:Gluconate 2-dehydrogenase subunit 3-like protein n=1 Tax=Novosphingobium ovatum TaxID=1908523 RepID=A0ABW9XCA8_9SPHN|nr:gluconate 2-dehydrogenase subunit 3 family protein [Novosphingobium ovatum]NBC36153.1 hypothetical protein [Novosphingobium ovatum]